MRPVIKKPSIEKTTLKNYRPLSNLPLLSKTIERVVAARLSAHMSEYNLCEPNQSAYKPNHSIKTTLVCVQNDILGASEQPEHCHRDVSGLVGCISYCGPQCDVKQNVLDGFKSYLSCIAQSIHINGPTSPAYLSINHPIHPSAILATFPFIHLSSIHPPTSPSTIPNTCPSFHLASIHLHIHLRSQ